MNRRLQALARAATYGALIAGSALFLTPFLWMVSSSLKELQTVYDFPPSLVPRRQLVVQRDGKTFRVGLYRPRPESPPQQVIIRRPERGGYWVEAVSQQSAVSGQETARTGLTADRWSLTAGRLAWVPEATVERVRPVSLRWENYREAWTAKPFNHYLLNTLIVTLSCIVGQVLTGSLVAFGFARLRFPGRQPLFFLVLATMMLPGQVTMIPVYLVFRHLGWIDTFLPLIVPSFLGGSAFYIFLFRQFFLTLPRELDEVARLDGCSSFRVYWNVLLPLCKPIVATIAVFSFIAHWNDFMGPLIYLNSPEKQTLALGLRSFQGTYTTHLHLLMAAATLVLLPILVVFFFAQKQFVRSVALTGIKG